MKVLIKKYFDSFVHIIFPHSCANCDSDTLHQDSFLCSKCFTLLPATGFFDVANNPVEKIFYGRVKIESAASGFYFNKHSIMQNLISQLKYRGNKEAGIFLGKQIGKYLNDSERFNTVDVIVPVPLNTQKEKKRGYNQSLIIAEGLVQEFKRPILNNLILRSSNTESQTKKSRSARFQNMQNVFEINKNSLFDFKHILIIDDVITTGATLESCCTVLHSLDGIKISIASVAIAQ